MKLFLICLLFGVAAGRGATTIDPAHPFAWGANIGWINARGDGGAGAAVGDFYCTGYLWSANCGWISLGKGPANGWRYSNATTGDWGVNHDGEGRLTGHAWGANIGWLTFEQSRGQPRVDLVTGNLSGCVWGANIGWISLSNARAYVRSATLATGPDSDADTIPDEWEFARAGDLSTLQGDGHDFDGDGVSDADEAGADTDPLDDSDRLTLVAFSVAPGTNSLVWRSRPTRLYRIEAVTNLSPVDAWSDAGGGLLGPPPSSPAEADVVNPGVPARFYRVRAIRPLTE